MKKLILTTTAAIALLATAACSPGQIAANKNGVGEYVWVGCHLITEMPKEGSYAFSPLGDLEVGDNFYFKQVSNHDTVGPVPAPYPDNGTLGSLGPVTTGKPCKQ